MQIKLWEKRVYLIKSLARSLASKKYHMGAYHECTQIQGQVCSRVTATTTQTPTSSLLRCFQSLFVSGGFALLAHARGGIAFSILVTSFGAIWLFCRLRTWLPLRNRCRPSASFQLSDSSMRKTYFFPSASRTEARRTCSPFEGWVPLYRTSQQVDNWKI